MLLPRLRQCDGKARVLNIGSGIADRVQSGTGTYGITKKALHRLTLQMAAELASVDVSEDSAQGIRACDGVDRRVWVAYARPGALKFLLHVDKCKKEDIFAILQVGIGGSPRLRRAPPNLLLIYSI